MGLLHGKTEAFRQEIGLPGSDFDVEDESSN